MITIGAVGVAVPLQRPTGIATRVIRGRHYVIIRLHSIESGVTGYGYAYVGTHGARSAIAIFEEVFVPILSEIVDDGISDIWESLYAETLVIGRGGLAIRVLSAIDIALWDLHTKEKNIALCEALGGQVRDVPAYASGGYYFDGSDALDAIRSEIKQNMDRGFDKHKIKVGGLDVDEDAQRISTAMEMLPPNHLLALDANNAYKTPFGAANALAKFENAAGDRGLWWFEEPLWPSDVKGHAYLRSRFATPIATGEVLQTRFDVRPYIDSEAVDILQIDAGVIGGISEFLKVAQAASVANISIAPHWHANLHAHFATVLENCFVIEHFIPEKDIYNFESLLVDSSHMSHRDGLLQIKNTPGIGLEFDPSQLTQHQVADYQW
jgi:L-alanine-DL-glutamate epimerase-like enolase superfamily enzyme